MEAVGRVHVQVLQAPHLPDLRWDTDEMAAVQAEGPDELQLRDGPRKLDDPHPVIRSELSSGPEHRPLVLSGFVDQFEHPSPRIALGVLRLRMELHISDTVAKALVLHTLRSPGPSQNDCSSPQHSSSGRLPRSVPASARSIGVSQNRSGPMGSSLRIPTVDVRRVQS